MQAAKFLSDPGQILAAMRTRIASGGPASIAIAFWGRGACEQLGLEAASPTTRVLLNADSGACNPEELKKLLELRHLEVKNAPRLHAKVVVSADRILVGSANASANGLGFDDRAGWAEACIELEEPRCVSNAKAWFELQWANAHERLSPAVIERAGRAFFSLQIHTTALRNSARIPGAIATVAEMQAGTFVVVVDEESEFSARQRKSMATALNVHVPTDVDYYQDWPAMPKHALLIAYFADRDSLEVCFDGYWVSSDGRSVLVPGVGCGYPVTKADGRVLRERGLTRKIKWKDSVAAVVKLFKSRPGLGEKLRREAHGRVQYSRATDWCMPVRDMLVFCAEHGCPVPVPWRAELASTEGAA